MANGFCTVGNCNVALSGAIVLQNVHQPAIKHAEGSVMEYGPESQEGGVNSRGAKVKFRS